jgi:hypothetical protein
MLKNIYAFARRQPKGSAHGYEAAKTMLRLLSLKDDDYFRAVRKIASIIGI